MTSRKLLAEIDRTIKKVSEGIGIFDDTYEKLRSTPNPSQKEKFEVELKKEIKKLQRLRDSIKTWLLSNEIKDKTQLTDNRRLIEMKMEQFKAIEREMKTKAYSKEGLAQSEKIDPRFKAKQESVNWIISALEQLAQQIDVLETEVETLRGTGRKGRRNARQADRIEHCLHWIERHKWHVVKLELVLRLLENDSLEPEQVDDVQDALNYYLEANQEDDFGEDEEIYDELNLDQEEEHYNIGLDEPTGLATGPASASPQSQPQIASGTDSAPGQSPSLGPALSLPKAAAAAEDQGGKHHHRSSSFENESADNTTRASEEDVDSAATAHPDDHFHQQQHQPSHPRTPGRKKRGLSSTSSSGLVNTNLTDAAVVSTAAASTAVAASAAAATVNSLNNLNHQQPAVTQKFSAVAKAGVTAGGSGSGYLQQQNPALLTTALSGAPKAFANSPPILINDISGRVRKSNERKTSSVASITSPSISVIDAVSPKQSFAAAAAAAAASSTVGAGAAVAGDSNITALGDIGNAYSLEHKVLSDSENFAIDPHSYHNQYAQHHHHHQQQQLLHAGAFIGKSGGGDREEAGAMGTVENSGESNSNELPIILEDLVATFEKVRASASSQAASGFNENDLDRLQRQLDCSRNNLPSIAEFSRGRRRPTVYLPKNPTATPKYYPQTPHATLDTPLIYERMDLSNLFYIFYHEPGTYRQWLATRQLKAHSWRYHMAYSTWFQRHEEPRAITNDFEQGSYVYFDYEKGWEQCMKSDFRFEYQYLEDELK